MGLFEKVSQQDQSMARIASVLADTLRCCSGQERIWRNRPGKKCRKNSIVVCVCVHRDAFARCQIPTFIEAKDIHEHVQSKAVAGEWKTVSVSLEAFLMWRNKRSCYTMPVTPLDMPSPWLKRHYHSSRIT